MSRPATIFLLIVAPGLAILLVFLGIETLHTNLLGWFLFLIGIVYTVGIVIDGYVRKDEFWGAKQSSDNLQEERGDLSFWPIALGIMVVFFLSPVEYLYFATFQPRTVQTLFGTCFGEERTGTGAKWALLHYSSSSLFRIYIHCARACSGIFKFIRFGINLAHLIASNGLSYPRRRQNAG